MDANQETRANPFGMDEDCPNCPALVESRSRVVHGYGDVGADFLFIGERPGPGADTLGVPFAGGEGGDERGDRLQSILRRLGLLVADSDPECPEVVNAFLTNLTRCRHPDRAPTDEEVATCEPYLNAEIRMINPEVLVPVGARALKELGEEYTTTPVEELDVEDDHARSIRGRGFELFPMIDPREQTEAQTQVWVEGFSELMAGDYRQTKGRRSR